MKVFVLTDNMNPDPLEPSVEIIGVYKSADQAKEASGHTGPWTHEYCADDGVTFWRGKKGEFIIEEHDLKGRV